MCLLAKYVAAHNQGVRTGSFTALGELLPADAEMHFHGLPLGPFVGRDAILAAFAAHPPDDELLLSAVERTPTGERAEYAWKTSPGVAAGTIELTARGDLIHILQIEVRGDQHGKTPPRRNGNG